MKFKRKKGRNFLLSLFYKVDKIIPLSKRRKLKLYLDLEWIFERLAHEQSFRVFGKEDHPVRQWSSDFLLRHVNRTDEVLDLGCNSGELTFLVSKHVKAITGIDHNPELIGEAKRKYDGSNITFINGDAVEYMIDNNRIFDVLILSHVLEHLDEPGLLLRTSRNYCTYFYIEVPDFQRTHLNLYRKHAESGLVYSDADHIWEFDREDVRQLVTECGLVIQDSEFIWGVQKYWCMVK